VAFLNLLIPYQGTYGLPAAQLLGRRTIIDYLNERVANDPVGYEAATVRQSSGRIPRVIGEK
jgi:hypothetical protein